LLDTARDYGPLASFRVGPRREFLASGLTLLRVGQGTSPIRWRASLVTRSGVVNTIKQAQAASGITKVYAVIGGFHLAPYPEDYVRQTIAALKEMDVDYVIPLHCSGEMFYELAKVEMPTKLLRSYTGTRFVFEGGGA
jgi:hypothetical protein